MSTTQNEQYSRIDKIIPVMLLLVAIPLSMVMWVGNVAFTIFRQGLENEEVIPPTRWLASTLFPLVVAAWGFKKRSINKSGALLGLVMAFFLTLSSYLFLICLLTFFVSSSKATRFRGKQKAKFEHDFKEGGQRNWVQVLCNGGMATALSIIYLTDAGAGERPIDFLLDYRASWLAMGIVGAFACSNGDTWASELGSVLSFSDPVLVTTFKRVPKGVNGGISPAGCLVSLLGGLVVGVAFYISLLYFVDSSLLVGAPAQWPVIPLAGLAGFLGSLIDSFLGATLQYSGRDKKSGLIVEFAGKDVEHICGRRILDNHSVNILSTILTALITPRIANAMWPY